MAEQAEAGVRQALYDLQRYLSDQLAPMMVADAVELLLRCPPQLVANEIHGWVDAQFRAPDPGLTVSDCVYHAMKKLHLMAEFDLIEKQMLEAYMEGLGEIVVGLCPEGDREFLRENLHRLGQIEDATASPVAVLHRQGGGSGAAVRQRDSDPTELSRGMRQFSILIERLARNVEQGDGSGPSEDLARHAFASAAVNSKNEQEFQRNVQQLSRLGVDSRMDQVFRSLGAGLPGWTLPVTADGEPGAAALPPSRSAEAMRRILEMTEDPEEGARRFNEMMQAAIEQFNEGRLVQAMTMLKLAERIVSEKKLDAEVVKSTRSRAHETLSPEKMREFADRPEKHDSLRSVLGFFPALTPKGLLRELHDEERRERRKLLLALLEVHGTPVRVLALELLEATLDGAESDPDGFFRRNLVFLLRRVPRPADAPLDRELDLLMKLSGWGHPPLVIKEAIAALGTISRPEPERVLMKRLAEMEELLVENDSGSDDSDELIGLVDRTAVALAQLGTTNAYRTIVTHALKREPKLGDTAARLDELADQDLSGDRELVTRIVKILQDELPSKVLGFVVRKGDGRTVHLIRALSGTTAPVVRQVLEDVAARFPEQDIAEEARKALVAIGATPQTSEAPSKTLTGDVELFGLPSLFQTLADSQVTGVLTLADREGETAGLLSFEQGKVHGCQVRSLRGDAAVYQLFEKPVPGTFTFTSQPSKTLESDAGTPPMEVLPLILEAMRRHDEFTQARVLVPDDSAFKPGTAKPRPMEDEPDLELTRAVWDKASGGVTPDTCETVLPYDSYRIRRLYAHWVENAALETR
jgi:hypothetical protein